MKIAMISLAYDPAGVGQMLCNAINNNTKHTINHILPTGSTLVERDKAINRFNIFMTPKQELAAMINEADLLHIHQIHPFQFKEAGPAIERCGVNWPEVLSKKPWVFHNHGGAFLINPPKFMKDIGKFKPQLLSCSPLTKYILPEAAWLPNLCPINDEMYLPTERDFDSTIKVCHKIWTEATKMYKGTLVLEEVADLLVKDGFDIYFKVFHNMQIDECLKESADYHVCIDNLTQGFIGMSGWESLSKGQVVIARLDPVVLEAYKTIGNGTPPPIINVSGMDELASVLRDLHDNRDVLKKLCKASRDWMEMFYTEDKIIDTYIKFYQSVIDAHQNMPIQNTKQIVERKKKMESKTDVPHESFEALPNKDQYTRMDGLMGSGAYNSYELDKIDEFWKEVGLIHDKDFIDCGVGVGRLTPIILKSKPRKYVGADFSTTMVKEFMQNFPAIECHCQDLANMYEIKDKSFDTAFIMYVFIHIVDEAKAQKAADELKRITRQHIVIGHDMTIPKWFQDKVDPRICRYVPREKLEKLFHPWKVKYYLEDYYQLFSPYDNDLDSKISFIVFENPDGVPKLPERFPN